MPTPVPAGAHPLALRPESEQSQLLSPSDRAGPTQYPIRRSSPDLHEALDASSSSGSRGTSVSGDEDDDEEKEEEAAVRNTLAQWAREDALRRRNKARNRTRAQRPAPPPASASSRPITSITSPSERRIVPLPPAAAEATDPFVDPPPPAPPHAVVLPGAAARRPTDPFADSAGEARTGARTDRPRPAGSSDDSDLRDGDRDGNRDRDAAMEPYQPGTYGTRHAQVGSEADPSTALSPSHERHESRVPSLPPPAAGGARGLGGAQGGVGGGEQQPPRLRWWTDILCCAACGGDEDEADEQAGRTNPLE